MKIQSNKDSLISLVELAFNAFKNNDKGAFYRYYSEAQDLMSHEQASFNRGHALVSVNDWLGEAKDFLEQKNYDKTETREDIVGFYYDWLTDEDWHDHNNE